MEKKSIIQKAFEKQEETFHHQIIKTKVDLKEWLEREKRAYEKGFSFSGGGATMFNRTRFYLEISKTAPQNGILLELRKKI